MTSSVARAHHLHLNTSRTSGIEGSWFCGFAAGPAAGFAAGPAEVVVFTMLFALRVSSYVLDLASFLIALLAVHLPEAHPILVKVSGRPGQAAIHCSHPT